MAIEFYDSLNVDSNDDSYFLGKVGIGTTSPAEKLTVSGNTNVTGKFAVGISAAHPSLDFYNNGTAYFNGSTTVDDNFFVTNGNVGIGTTSPSAPLDVRRTDTSGKVAEFHNNAGYGINIDVESDGGVNTIASATNQSLAFVTNGGSNERMRIDIAGNVGIGTTNPGAKLQIGSATHAPNANLANNLLQIKSASGYAYLTIGNGDSANATSYIGGASGFIVLGSVTDAGVTSEHIRMTNTGNVGIGTNAPGEKLEVAGNIKLGDNNKLLFGAGNDLEIFHDGSNSLIKDVGTGFLIIESDAALVLQNGAGEAYLQAISNGQVNLYYNGNKKFETTTSGVTVTGTVDLTNLTVSGAQGTDGQVLTSTGSGIAWEDAGGGSSPWTTDTNGITYTAGNVGIGAASQASTDLRVGGFARFNGDVRFDGDVQCAGGDLIVNNSLKDVNSATGTSGQILSSEGAGGGVEWIDAGVKSSTSGEPSGSDSVINIVSLTQAEYDAGTPVATTLYIIT